MKNILKWQLISLFSRGVAVFVGIFQSFFIVRLLTVGEYGIVQIAAAVGATFGIYQHLGLASGSTREISAAKDDTEVFKIFITSVLIRYLVTFPIAIGLFFGATYIALNQYNEPALIVPIKIYAVVLMFQGVQGILNSVVSGTQRFKTLFTYQAVIAFVSAALYIPLVYMYKVNGYFYAMFIHNVVAAFALAYLAFKPLKIKYELPSKEEFKLMLKQLLSISLAVYFVKVIFTMWEKSGPLILGREISHEMVGVFAFALLYSKKLVHISDAITDVNLPVLSEKFVHNFEEFKKLFSTNFNKVFVFILLPSFSAVYWSKEVIRLVVGDNRYDGAFPLILPLVFTFVLYSFINILKSSIFVPAKYVKELVLGFVLLLLGTIGFYLTLTRFFDYSKIGSMSLGLLFGVLMSFIFLIIVSQKKLKFKYITHEHTIILFQVLIIALANDISNIWLKILIYALFTLMYLWAVYIANFITKSDIDVLVRRFSTLSKRLAR